VQRCALFWSDAETKVSLVDEIGQEIGRYVSEDVSAFDTAMLRVPRASCHRIDMELSQSPARHSFAL
jgi:hypothetical protein